MFLLINETENFTSIQALDAVKATEKKVNDMVVNAGADHIDLKSKIRLSGKWTDSPSATNSEIANDTVTHKKLMIVGNKSAGGVRKVGVWDHLDVHGNQVISGNLTVNGIINKKKERYWKGGKHEGHGNKIHYLDRQNNSCPHGEFMSGIKWLKHGDNIEMQLLCNKLN